MATTGNGRKPLGQPLTLDAVAEQLGWDEQAVEAHLAERRHWARETVERLGSRPVSQT